MKPLRQRMIGALEDIEWVSGKVIEHHNRFAATDVHPDVQRSFELHIEGVRDGYRIIQEFGNAPEDFEALLQLRREKPADFAAIMDLARRELERPAPAEEARAA